jgi:hypothetical protein
MRKRLGGERSWWKSMVRFGVVGVLGNPVVRMGWSYGSTFVGGGGCSNATLDLTLVLGPISSFGRTSGVATRLSRIPILDYSILPPIRMYQLRITGSD